MRWVEFTQVMISEENGQLRVAKAHRILRAKAVYSVVPGTVPSEVAGPNGEAMGKPAAILLTNNEQILVDSTVSEALYKLTWESVKIEAPEGVEEDEYIITKTVKRPVPHGGSLNQSSILL